MSTQPNAQALNRNSRRSKRRLARLGATAGAVTAICGFLTYVFGLLLPQPSVRLSISGWRLLKEVVEVKEGKEIKQYRYAFEMRVRNMGNVPIKMSPAENRLVTMCSNTPPRPDEKSPLIKIVRTEATSNLVVASKKDNVLQLSIRSLLVPLYSAETVTVEVLSPIYDLGGIYLSSNDPMLKSFWLNGSTNKDECYH